MATTLEKIKNGLDRSQPWMPALFRVERIRKETYDTFTFDLETSDGNGLSFQPGQFNMLYIYGVGEVPISISGDPGNTRTLVHTIRAVGTVTKNMRQLKRGDLVGVRGPFGRPWPVAEAKGHDIIIVAGGIGLAPLRPVIYHLIAHREQYGKIILQYGARTPDDILFRQELETWRARFDFDVQVTVDRSTGAWKGNVGVVTLLIPKATFDPMHTIAMVCGPEIMMRFTVLELLKRDLTEENIYISGERNMKCGIGHCGHCQFGHLFVCKDGPVFRYSETADLFKKREI